MELIKGKVWKLGDNIDTDAIVSGQYLNADMEKIQKHVLESILPSFAVNVSDGDIIISGINFGCGSSRENAPAALKTLGIGCIVAESFGRIFFRNAIAIGLPLLTAPRIAAEFDPQDRAEVLINESKIINVNKNITIKADPLSPEILKILEIGGILNLLKEEKL